MFEVSQSELFGIVEPKTVEFTYDVLDRVETQSFLNAEGAVVGVLTYAYFGETNNVQSILRTT